MTMSRNWIRMPGAAPWSWPVCSSTPPAWCCTGCPPRADCTPWWLVWPLPRPLSQHDLNAVLPAEPPTGTGQVLRLVDTSPDPAIAAALTARAASEVLVAPLRGAGQLLGVIEVHDRQSRLRRFGAADERLVQTMASHLATALDNCRLLAQLRHDAYHDSLTNLRNRLGFREAAAEVLRRDVMPCAVIVVELGLLSSVNDALGHVWGDRVVLGAGERLRRILPAQVTHRPAGAGHLCRATGQCRGTGRGGDGRTGTGSAQRAVPGRQARRGMHCRGGRGVHRDRTHPGRRHPAATGRRGVACRTRW